MTTKAAFTPEEWTSIIQAPLNVAMLITTASPSIFGSMTEMYSAARGLVEAGQLPTPPNELMGAIFGEYRDRETVKQAQPKYEAKDPAGLHTQIMGSIAAAAATVDTKATPEEASAFKQWLYDFGVRQANASKEGGFLGIGAVRVSESEKAALAELAKTLGIQPAAEQPAAEQPAAEQPAAEQPAAEQPAAEQPAAKPEEKPEEK